MLSKKELEYLENPKKFLYENDKHYTAQIRYRIRKKVDEIFRELYLILEADTEWRKLYRKFRELREEGHLSKKRLPKNVYDPCFTGKDLPPGVPLDMFPMYKLYDFIRKLKKERYWDSNEIK